MESGEVDVQDSAEKARSKMVVKRLHLNVSKYMF